MIAEAGSVDPSRYTGQYELLRSQVIGARCAAAQPDALGQPRGVGLALMLREGMPGWLKAITAVIREAATAHACESVEAAPSQPAAGRTCAPVGLSGVPRQDLTALLTSLVLSTRSVEPASPGEEVRSWH